ncbi:MAG: nucleoid-associated protein [Rikenellaceae bacterium]
MEIVDVVLHKVGSKTSNDVCIFSQEVLDLDESTRELLRVYFSTPFEKTVEYYNLYHDSDLSLNEVYSYVSNIFDDADSLVGESVNLAKHLYEKSIHPKIKNGEFYVVHFEDCEIGGQVVEAIGVFKSENKDTFLKVNPNDGIFELDAEQGVNIKKLDKGAIIFNIEREGGYMVAVVDNTNKGIEAHFWVDEFLHVRQRRDEFYDTTNILTMCKSFVTKELPEQFEVSRADQVDMLNRSVAFFKENETFEMDSFCSEVIEQPEVINSFSRYKDNYEKELDIEVQDGFAISDSAVKKQARSFRSVIKLDKNFHIYVHGNRELMEQGEDAGGKFYKVYYKEES